MAKFFDPPQAKPLLPKEKIDSVYKSMRFKVFMGSSTGNMLVDEGSSLGKLFSIKEKPVLVHCEDESTIKANLDSAIEKYGDEIPFEMHPLIRSREACTKCTSRALKLALKCSSRLHILHPDFFAEFNAVNTSVDLLYAFAVTLIGGLVIRLLHITQEFDQFRTHLIVICTLGIQKDAHCAVLKRKLRAFIATGTEGVAELSFSEQIEGSNHDDTGVVQLVKAEGAGF